MFTQIFPSMSYVLHIMIICDVTSDLWRHSQYSRTWLTSTMQREQSFQSCLYYYIAMSAKSLLCRLHWASVPDTKSPAFIRNSLEREWPSRISALVNIPVNGCDQFSHHVCSMCLMRDIILEKASVNLASFKRSTRSLIEQAPQPIKRRKETRGEVNVPPNTFRKRPQSKIPRWLPFSSKVIQS